MLIRTTGTDESPPAISQVACIRSGRLCYLVSHCLRGAGALGNVVEVLVNLLSPAHSISKMNGRMAACNLSLELMQRKSLHVWGRQG